MADLFVTLVSVVPKPSTVRVTGPNSHNVNTGNGLFPAVQQVRVVTPGSGK